MTHPIRFYRFNLEKVRSMYLQSHQSHHPNFYPPSQTTYIFISICVELQLKLFQLNFPLVHATAPGIVRFYFYYVYSSPTNIIVPLCLYIEIIMKREMIFLYKICLSMCFFFCLHVHDEKKA